MSHQEQLQATKRYRIYCFLWHWSSHRHTAARRRLSNHIKRVGNHGIRYAIYRRLWVRSGDLSRWFGRQVVSMVVAADKRDLADYEKEQSCS